jgi:DNA-binding XRE family transcriptional regulator
VVTLQVAKCDKIARIYQMKKEKFSKLRKKLGKTQKEMATLLSVSKKTVESYEQGLRNIPSNVQRLLYFLVFKLNMHKFDNTKLCWVEKDCPPKIRENCVTWVANEGFFCWFMTGKVCETERLASGKTTGNCFNCSFFKSNLDKILS